MANEGGTQPELLVEFAGLCLYVGDREKHQVTILMPDARASADPLHPDGEEGQPHVGYIRFDLANLDLKGIDAVPGALDNGSGSPPNEIVHRFDRHHLSFDFAPEDRVGGAMDIAVKVPNFNEFAPSLEAIGGLLTRKPPDALLMRTTISGGGITAEGLGKTWEFSSVLFPDRPKVQSYRGSFAGFALWRRPIKSGKVTITISDFAGKPVLQIPLKARRINGRDVIAIKVANLCSHNPLEWDDFPIRTVVKHDLDFKWLYRLLAPKGEKYSTALAGAELPFPRATPNQAFGDEDCMGGYIETPLK